MAIPLDNRPGPTANMDLLALDDRSLALVAALLMEEIQDESDARLAEELQLDSIRTSEDESLEEGEIGEIRSAGFQGAREEWRMHDDDDEDRLFSMNRQVDLINSTLSQSAIEGIASTDREIIANSVRAQQLDQQLEATARKEQLDHEFAKALQKGDDDGFNIDEMAEGGIEATLGERRVRELMMGKGIAIDEGSVASVLASSLPTCSICFEPVCTVSNPYSESLKPRPSSEARLFGMYIGPRQDAHVACLDCFGSYVENKLDDRTAKAFPLKCFEVACAHELTDEDAIHGLGPENLDVWHYRKLANAVPPFYCPNRACSVDILRHEQDEDDTDPRAECPSCKVAMCIACKSPWHEGYTCERYQALPADERTPEDIAVFKVAQEEGYSRCPGCKALIELSEGCFHMTCPCGTESCYLCGKLWDKAEKRCSKDPPCPLFLEDRLLRPEYREVAPAPLPLPPQRDPVVPAARRQWYRETGARNRDSREARRLRRLDVLEFLNDGRQTLNEFTHTMRRTGVCGYCNARFHCTGDLQQHLAALDHSVFVCCETLFWNNAHLQQHLNASDLGIYGEPHKARRYIV
ncbi:hypothetical protein JCM16303_003085 [Sporobolomyces ruberrimus]